MRDFGLGQTLLVTPETPFARIAAVLAAVGWQAEQQSALPPLVESEPEVANWSWRGHKPFVIYSFNPVARLRVLDVATVPPGLREAIAAGLPLLDDHGIAQLLTSDDARERLLGLWSARETENVDFIELAERLAGDPEPVVAEHARDVAGRLRQINQARYDTLAKLGILAEAAPPLIRRLGDPAFLPELKPDAAALPELFDENLATVAGRAVAAVYGQRMRVAVAPDAHIEVFPCLAGLLRWPNPLSEKFPRGYRDIAGWMHPHRVWLCWSITTPGGTTVRYDGLVWLHGRWLWLPKIYRYLAPYLLDDPAAAGGRH